MYFIRDQKRYYLIESKFYLKIPHRKHSITKTTDVPYR